MFWKNPVIPVCPPAIGVQLAVLKNAPIPWFCAAETAPPMPAPCNAALPP